MEEDWDLHAVVRSCTAASSSGSNFQPRTDNDNNNSSVFCFQDPVLKSSILLNKNKIIDDFEELHQLCKPFYTQQSEQITVISSPRKLLLQNLPPSPSPSQQQQQQFTLIQPKRPLSCTLHAQSPRTKRRKNQLKKVCEVAADGLSSDMWSWRKYGQKPIKGSPYPRGYYRCSSSKGCSAKKQVERCSKDASLFVITYTSSHNHPGPNLPKDSVTQEQIVDQHVSLEDNNDDDDDNDDTQSCKSPLNSTTTGTSIPQGILEENLFSDSFLGTISYDDFLPLSYPQLMKFPKSELSEENDFYDELGELELPPSSTSFAGIFEEAILVDPSS